MILTFLTTKILRIMAGRYSSVVEYLPSVSEALVQSPVLQKVKIFFKVLKIKKKPVF
jgi:hypothetical protein